MSSRNQNVVEMILNKKLLESLPTQPTENEDASKVLLKTKEGNKIGEVQDLRLTPHNLRKTLLLGPTLGIYIGPNLITTIPTALMKAASVTVNSDIHLPPYIGKEEVEYLINYLRNICYVEAPFTLHIRKNLPKDLAVIRAAWHLGLPVYVEHLCTHYWTYIATSIPTDADISAVEDLDFRGKLTKSKKWFFHVAMRLARLRFANKLCWNQRKKVLEGTAMLKAVESALEWLKEQQRMGKKKVGFTTQEALHVRQGKKGRRKDWWRKKKERKMGMTMSAADFLNGGCGDGYDIQ